MFILCNMVSFVVLVCICYVMVYGSICGKQTPGLPLGLMLPANANSCCHTW